MVQVTEQEYSQFMEFIAAEILDIKLRYNSLQATKDSWNDRFNPTIKTSGLTLEEIDELQASLVSRQHALFRQWHSLHGRYRRIKGMDLYTPAKMRELGSYILSRRRVNLET